MWSVILLTERGREWEKEETDRVKQRAVVFSFKEAVIRVSWSATDVCLKKGESTMGNNVCGYAKKCLLSGLLSEASNIFWWVGGVVAWEFFTLL